VTCEKYEMCVLYVKTCNRHDLEAMSTSDKKGAGTSRLQATRYDLAYGLLLFISAIAVLSVLVARQGFLGGDYGTGTALFFLIFGLFTITMGYSHPHFGHVSFDRVAQVASILVLGPVDAALISGVASLIYPWHRLWNGEAPRSVMTASVLNSGMMILVILFGGTLYTYLGGQVPLATVDLRAAGLLLLLMFGMQLVNDACMLILLLLRKDDPAKLLTLFSTGVEMASVLVAVIVALVFVRMEPPIIALLLAVLSLCMFVIMRFAEMRLKLEALVAERTNELQLKTIELERQATHDKLTGIFNRRYADDYLQREIEATRRHGRPMSIALADIDHFKQINDQYSHAVGDEVLRRIAKLLVDRCRKTDVVARYGGEEFLLCFPDTETDFAEQICGQIRLAVESTDWSSLFDVVPCDNSNSLNLTISFGIAEVGDESRRTTILSAADTRLYKAKNSGRNRVVA
jgi:diguanylate cyclase (GGDEF)-like protein